MSGIDNIFKTLKDFADLEAYARSQYNTIIELTKKLNRAEDEISHLKALLTQQSISLDSPSPLEVDPSTSDQETICRIQLKKLKDKSLNGEELTLEETKRVEIYSKLLISFASTKKKPQSEAEALPTDELLKLVKGMGGGE